ncbi:MAG: hypothetical protein JWP91_2943 [Fibrobacteres bacterium]|nr:hypothetical protein [Fibrobacterota bacterium]
MNRIVKKNIIAAMVLAAATIARADIVVDDFSGEVGSNLLPKGGAWLADADTWPAIGGSSKVTDPIEGSDLVKGDIYSGDNISKAYTDNGITSKIYVTADVSTTKKWAYAGWVMDFMKPAPLDTTKPVYELNSWEKRNEVDLTSCDALELTLSFDVDRMLWIDLFSPQIERMNALAPQWGWRYTGTGLMETKKFNLRGVTGPQQKWKDDANKVPLDLKTVTRIRWLYEGMKKGTATAAYDTVGHNLTIKKVAMTGTTCAITAMPGSSLPIVARSAAKSALAFSAANGSLRFDNVTSGLKVTVRNIAGNIVAEGAVNGSHPSLNVSALKNGVYMVQAGNGKAGSFTVLK